MDTLHTAFLAACLYIVVVKEMDNILAMSEATWTMAGAVYVTVRLPGARGLAGGLTGPAVHHRAPRPRAVHQPDLET
jgi:hypothetical protein